MELSIINLTEKVKKGLLILLGLFFLVEFAFSQSWRIYIDTPLYHYGAFLFDRYHAVPYRDFFDMNMPLTYMIHLGIGTLFGYGDLAIKLIDSFLLVLLLFMMGKLMYRFGRYAALTSVVLFGLLFLGYGPYMIMQREYLGIFPIMLSLLITVGEIKMQRKWLRILTIGMLFGISASIKPQLIIGLPVMLIYINRHPADNESANPSPLTRWIIWDHLLAIAGAALVFSIPLLWLWHRGGLSAFVDIVVNFFPLYAQVSPTHQPISGIEKLVNTDLAIQELANKGGMLVTAVLAVYLFLTESQKKREKSIIYLLSTLAGVYFVYPVIAAKFYVYHWMPYYFFLSLLCGLIFCESPERHPKNVRVLFPLIVFTFGVLTSLNPAKEFVSQLIGQNATSLPYERVDRMADYLKRHLHEGDKVQPWGRLASGSQYAMLQAGANLATPFPLDQLIYHFEANAYIKKIRKEYVDKMIATQPRFILETFEAGREAYTRSCFPELDELVRNHYKIAEKGMGYCIYELTRR